MDKKIEEIYHNALKNSVGETKKEKFKRRIKKISSITGILLISISTGVSFCSCSSHDYTTIQRLSDGSAYEAVDILKKYNLYKENLKDITIEEYAMIPEINDDNLISFYILLGEGEINKVAIAIGYNDLNDFLVKNDYVDTNGNPSVYEWKKDYVDGNIKQR